MMEMWTQEDDSIMIPDLFYYILHFIPSHFLVISLSQISMVKKAQHAEVYVHPSSSFPCYRLIGSGWRSLHHILIPTVCPILLSSGKGWRMFFPFTITGVSWTAAIGHLRSFMSEFFFSHPSFPFCLFFPFLYAIIHGGRVTHCLILRSWVTSNCLEKCSYIKGVIEDVLGKSHRRAVRHAQYLIDWFCVIFSQVSFLAYLILSLLSSLP